VSAATLVSAVSTAAVAAEDRLSFWEQYNAAALVGLTAGTYSDDGLLARQVNLDLGGVRVAEIAGNAHVIEREPGLVRSSPKDATFFSLLLEGEAFFYHSGGCVTLGAGDLLVYDTDRPYLFGFGTDMRQLLLDVPRALLAERGGPTPVAQPRKVPGGQDPAASALRRLLTDLVADPAGAAPTVREDVLALAQGVLTGPGNGPAAAHLLAARAYVDRHLRDPRLRPDAVAAAVGITARHLNRAFGGEGTTVARYIQARRLDGARAELVAVPGLRVADVAHRWAFASQAHFTRAFRARFGCPPSSVQPPPPGRGRG
jgi:AraC-like DNA-binding protein